MRSAPASARARDRRLGARLGAADLEGDDGLAGTRGPERGGAEFLRVTDRFDVQRDDLRGRIVDQRVDEIGQLEVTSLLVDTSFDRLMPRAAARDRSALRMPPLCDTTPMAPAWKWSISSAPLAESTMRSVRFTSRWCWGPGCAGFRRLPAVAAGVERLPRRPGVAARQHDGRGSAALGKLAHGDMGLLRSQQHDAHIGDFRQRGHVA
jgi:hypothetical protein